MDTYEKKYKEALEKARQLCAYPTSKPFISDLQDLFPELTESEDEKIRKEIMDFIDTKTIDSDERRNRWFSWLEKQGEQKSAWSEEDSFRTETLISVIKSGGSIRPELRNEFVKWLKSLKVRLRGNL